jgi:hypothetical protein
MGKAASDPEAAVNVVASVFAPDATPGTWVAAIDRRIVPAAARIVAAERLRRPATDPAAAIAPLARVVVDRAEPVELRAAAATALRWILGRRILDARFAARPKAPALAAAERSLGWLAEKQRTRARGGDGRWACDALGKESYDLGVTGLALLAFLAAGHTEAAPGPYAENIRDGIAFVLSTQTKEGLFRDGQPKERSLLEHAIATHALCEAIAMGDDPQHRASAQAALAVCAAARNPEAAWRYAPRGGDNDTHMTTWMLTTLRVADELGFVVDRDAYPGAAEWIWKMTDPNFGQVGYNFPGGPPFRDAADMERFPPDKSQAMTAAGLWCRVLLGEDLVKNEMGRKGLDLCVERAPTFEEDGTADFYFWYYGSLSAFEGGGKWWKRWSASLESALIPRQRPDGAWDAEDVWGFVGGPVYATATCTLALLTPWRYPRGWAREGGFPGPYGAAAAALADAAASLPRRLRAAAANVVVTRPEAPR